jgi:glucose/arabinose dehydrogenase
MGRAVVLDGSFRATASHGLGPGAGLGHLSDPRGVAVGADGALYVADRAAAIVQTFLPSGEIYSFGGVGEALGELRQPWGVDVCPGGLLLVSEQANGRISAFGPDGTRVGVLKQPRLESDQARFCPMGVAGISSERCVEAVVAADYANDCIKIFRPLE